MESFHNAEDKSIYFHCGKSGHRIDALKAHNKVSFCTYTKGYRNDGEWALNIESVIVFGKIEIIDSIEIIKDITEKLSRKFTDDEEYIRKEISSFADKTLLLKLTPEHICGKKITES